MHPCRPDRLQLSDAASRALCRLSLVDARPNFQDCASIRGSAQGWQIQVQLAFDLLSNLAFPWHYLAGVLDAFGHLGYIVAATRDSMGIAAAVVALFPCVSVLLAVLVLQERLNFLLSCGILTTIASVVLLAVSLVLGIHSDSRFHHSRHCHHPKALERSASS